MRVAMVTVINKITRFDADTYETCHSCSAELSRAVQRTRRAESAASAGNRSLPAEPSILHGTRSRNNLHLSDTLYYSNGLNGSYPSEKLHVRSQTGRKSPSVVLPSQNYGRGLHNEAKRCNRSPYLSLLYGAPRPSLCGYVRVRAFVCATA